MGLAKKDDSTFKSLNLEMNKNNNRKDKVSKTKPETKNRISKNI